MLIREILPTEKQVFNQVATHPLQSWEWGEFRKTTGVKVERLGFYQDGQLQKSIQVTFHKIPFSNRYIGYFPKGYTPDADQMAALQELAKKYQAIFIKLEPNSLRPLEQSDADNQQIQFLKKYPIEKGRALFTQYSFWLDLQPDEETLLANVTSKTRYNIRLAEKRGVRVYEDSSERGLEDYLAIQEETTKRQGFYAHSAEYFRKLYAALKDSGIMHIFKAEYENQILVTWIVFVFNGVLYYPYGASRSIHRDVMASNLMMWEVIRFGKAQGCRGFDMWGALGPNPDEKDPWYGFHRFKKGYGAELIEFLGSFDLVNDDPIYKLYTLGETWRWRWLRFRKKLPF